MGSVKDPPGFEKHWSGNLNRDAWFYRHSYAMTRQEAWKMYLAEARLAVAVLAVDEGIVKDARTLLDLFDDMAKLRA
jgi:hypothetical protein